MLRDLLEARMHVVYDAADGAQAIQLIAEHRPDVAFIDIGLPVMDGLELARRLRTLPGLEALRIVAVSGYGSALDRERSEDAGIDAHLVKPVDYGRLRELLRH
jgi:CheY-like chemotaxis protein